MSKRKKRPSRNNPKLMKEIVEANYQRLALVVEPIWKAARRGGKR